MKVALGVDVAVAEGAVVAVDGSLVSDGVSVGKVGMTVTPGTGVSVGILGTQSFCPT